MDNFISKKWEVIAGIILLVVVLIIGLSGPCERNPKNIEQLGTFENYEYGGR